MSCDRRKFVQGFGAAAALALGGCATVKRDAVEFALEKANKALGDGRPEGSIPEGASMREIKTAVRVDLDLPPRERWVEAHSHLPGKDDLGGLVAAAKRLVGIGLGYPLLAGLTYPFYEAGSWAQEVDAVAHLGNVWAPDIAILQRLYSLAYLVPMGCSACVIEDVRTKEKRHFRSLDWPMIRAMTDKSQLHHFHRSSRNAEPVFTSAGLFGMVGALSVAKTGFAVSINYAPQRAVGSLNHDPLLWLRAIVESEDVKTYSQAVDALAGRTERWGKSASPVFFVVSGPGLNEACVIQWGSASEGADAVPITAGTKVGDDFLILAQTNHYSEDSRSDLGRHLARVNPVPGLLGTASCLQYLTPLRESSMERRKALLQRITTLLEKNRRLPEVDELRSQVYSSPPVFNFENVQWVFLDAVTGSTRMWVRNEEAIRPISRGAVEGCFNGGRK